MRYSKDFRTKVMTFKEQHGLSVRETAERFDLSPTTVQAWIKRLEAHKPGRPLGRGDKLNRDGLRVYMMNHPDAYQQEVASHFGVGRFTVWHALQQIAWSCKKNVGTSKGKYT
jgi:transposase